MARETLTLDELNERIDSCIKEALRIAYAGASGLLETESGLPWSSLVKQCFENIRHIRPADDSWRSGDSEALVRERIDYRTRLGHLVVADLEDRIKLDDSWID